jgi:cell division protein FtsN
MRDYEEKSYYEIQLDNKQLILVFLAGMTVCVLIFVLGVMVGKGKKEAEMVAMKNEATTTTAAPVPDVSPPQEIQPVGDESQKEKGGKNRKTEKENKGEDAKSSDDYAFYDLDKNGAQQPLTKEPVPDTKQKDATKVTEKKEAEQNKTEKKEPETKVAKQIDTKKVDEPKVTEDTKNEEPVEESVRTSLPDTTEEPAVETTSTGGKYTVQVMATASKNKADEQLQLLKAKGYTAFMHTDQIQGGSIYKVRVGRFPDPGSAKKTQSKLKQDLKLETWVAVLD